MADEFSPDPATNQPQEQGPPSVTGLREFYQHYGVEGADRYQSDAELAADLYRSLHAARNDPRAQQAYQKLSEYEKELADPEYQSWKKERQARATPPKPKHPLEEPLPEYNKSWDELIVYDPASGKHVINRQHPYAGTAAQDLPLKWKAAQDARQARLDDLLGNFPKHHRDFSLQHLQDPEYRKAVVEALRDDFRSEFGDMASHRETAGQTLGYAMDPQNGIFHFDQYGRPVVSGYDQSGQPVFAQTEKGNLFERYAQDVRGILGIPPNKQPTPQQAMLIQRKAIERLETDMAMGDGLIRMLQGAGQPQQQQGAPQRQAPATPRQRNQANKSTWLNEAIDEHRDHPGDSVPAGRQVARNGRSDKSLVEICEAMDAGLIQRD